MRPQHKSLFSYNLTRPYPYRWFTPVTLIGGVLLTALFSWLNYALNGFDMVVTTSLDPNATLADAGVLRGLPKMLTSKYKPNCQPNSIPVNGQFFTNNTGLKYELLQVARIEDGMGAVVLPALTYANNVLQDCEVTSTQLEIASTDRTATQLVLTGYGVVVRSYATCNISTPEGLTIIDFMNVYDLAPPTRRSYSVQRTADKTNGIAQPDPNFVSLNMTSKGSLWWGSSILSAYWVWFVESMTSQNTGKDGSQITKGFLSFRQAPNASVHDILDPYFLITDWRFNILDSDGHLIVYWYGNETIMYAAELTSSKIYPETWWAPAEKLAKSAWSTILVDLGQTNESNVLLNDQDLASFTADFDVRHNDTGNMHPGPEKSPYQPAQHRTGPLGTTPAVIATTYVCNIPRRKAPSTIAWSVIVADLVFLQAVWTIFKLVVDAYVVKKKPHMERSTSSEYLLVPTTGPSSIASKSRSSLVTT